MKLKQKFHRIHSSFGPKGQVLLERLYSAVPMRFRKKRGFWNYLDFLRKSQWESPEWHNEYQNGQLRSLLEYISTASPFYKTLIAKNKIDIRGFKSVSDLINWPILDKDVLVKNANEMLPVDFPKSQLIVNSTSGSTGHPFKFYQDYNAVMREEAFAVRHWENAGLKLIEPTVYLRSYIPNNEKSLYKYSPANNRHYFSGYHLDRSVLSEYMTRMKASKAHFIFGYPSSLEIMADLLLEAGEQLNFKAAITGSEKLSASARMKIEKAFNTKVFDWYGLAEPTVAMGQCENGNYHVFTEYGMAELLDADNNPITKDGEVGRIVGTNFTNRALPLIRYDTGDLGTFTSKQCDCGRGLPVILSSIEGRKDDLLIGANGQYLPSVNFYTLFAHLSDEVQRFQLIQNERNKFTLKLIRGPEFTEQSLKSITKGLNERIGGHPEVKIESVERIAPTKAGKIRAVIREFEISKPVGANNEN